MMKTYTTNVILIICDRHNFSLHTAIKFNDMLTRLKEKSCILMHNDHVHINSMDGNTYEYHGRWDTVSNDTDIYVFMDKHNFISDVPDSDSNLQIRVITVNEFIKFIDEFYDEYMKPVPM